MISRLFSRFRTTPPPAKFDTIVPEGAVVWAVGDVHGRLDLLEPLLGRIVIDLEASSPERGVLVFLGDYVDRGDESRQVIDLLCLLQDRTAIELHFLKGNHEDRMDAFLRDPMIGPSWIRYGGREALASYGIQLADGEASPEDWAQISARFGEIVSPRHRRFLASLRTHFEIGDYYFVHAGVRPEVPLDLQSEADKLWIRDAFLNHRRLFERVIVHGHTPAPSVFSDARRIGLDTGAYSSGILSAVRLQNTDRRFLRAVSRDGNIGVEWIGTD